jgi:hypothetical protein
MCFGLSQSCIAFSPVLFGNYGHLMKVDLLAIDTNAISSVRWSRMGAVEAVSELAGATQTNS